MPPQILKQTLPKNNQINDQTNVKAKPQINLNKILKQRSTRQPNKHQNIH